MLPFQGWLLLQPEVHLQVRWVQLLMSGHDLAREIIRKHKLDRFPTIAACYRHLADETGELAEALMLLYASHNRDPLATAQVRKEYGDVGLTLYALGNLLRLNLDECMREVVINETRTFT